MIKTSAQEAYRKFAAQMTDKERDAFRTQQMLAGTLGVGGTGAGAGHMLGRMVGKPGLGTLLGAGAGGLLGAGTGALAATKPFTKNIHVDEDLKKVLDSPVATGIGQGVGMGLAGGGLMANLPRGIDWAARSPGIGRALALGTAAGVGPALGGLAGQEAGRFLAE